MRLQQAKFLGVSGSENFVEVCSNVNLVTAVHMQVDIDSGGATMFTRHGGALLIYSAELFYTLSRAFLYPK